MQAKKPSSERSQDLVIGFLDPTTLFNNFDPVQRENKMKQSIPSILVEHYDHPETRYELQIENTCFYFLRIANWIELVNSLSPVCPFNYQDDGKEDEDLDFNEQPQNKETTSTIPGGIFVAQNGTLVSIAKC